MSNGNAGIITEPILRENKVTLYRLHPTDSGRVIEMPNLPNGLHEAEMWRKKGFKATPQELNPQARLETNPEGEMFLVPPGYKLESFVEIAKTNYDKATEQVTSWRVAKETVRETTPSEETKLACPDCGKECKGEFGLRAHMKSHKK